MTFVIIFPLLTLLHGILTKAITEHSPLGEHHPRCSMTDITNKTVEQQNILPMDFHNLPRFSIYIDQPAENKQT